MGTSLRRIVLALSLLTAIATASCLATATPAAAEGEPAAPRVTLSAVADDGPESPSVRSTSARRWSAGAHDSRRLPPMERYAVLGAVVAVGALGSRRAMGDTSDPGRRRSGNERTAPSRAPPAHSTTN